MRLVRKYLRYTGTLAGWLALCACLTTYSATGQITDSTSYDVLTDIVERLRRGPASPELGEAVSALAVRHLLRHEDADQGIKDYLEAIRIYDQLNDHERVAGLRIDLALLYLAEGYEREAINLLEQAQQYYAAEVDSVLLGVIANFMGDAYLGIDSIETGTRLIREARAIANAFQDPLLRSLNTTSIQALSRGGIKIDPAVDTSSNLEPPTSVTPDFYSLVLVNSAKYHLSRNQLTEAGYYLYQVIETATLDGELLRDTYMHLAELNQRRGNLANAYMYLQEYSRLNDSLLNARRQRIINELLIRHNTLEQQAKIRELEKDRNIATINSRLQKILTFSLLFGSVIVLLGAYLTIRNYQQRFNANQIIHKQNEEINQRRITELENNLKIETMQSMILGQEAERERIARDLHDSLGGLLSTVKLHFDAVQTHSPAIRETREYRQAHALLDEACREVRNISNNMQPGALLRLGVVPAINDLINRLQSDATAQIEFQHFGLNGELDQTVSLNIFRIVQELL
ncbi:MAG: histidine kinase, partial [Saprospiraceae bacterium]|nr:histidine kinase [Saprospiraceae bacterium]